MRSWATLLRAMFPQSGYSDHTRLGEVLPCRWVIERTWAWLVNHRRLRVDYERDPAVTEGFVWAAQARLLLRRLTTDPVS